MQGIIGANIKHYRLAVGMKQEDLCRGLFSVSQLSKIETGKIQAKPEQLEELSKRLGISIGKLCSRDTHHEELSHKLRRASQLGNFHKYELATPMLEEVVEASAHNGYDDLYVEALYQQSRNFEYQGEWAEVVRVNSHLLSSGKVSQPSRRMELWGQLGVSHQYSGNMGLAYRYFQQEAIYIEDIQDDDLYAMRVYYRYSAHQLTLRNYQEAYRFAKKTVSIAERLHKHIWRLRATSLLVIAMNKMDIERGRRRELLKSCLEEAEENAMFFDAAVLANNFGTYCLLIGELALARQFQEASIQYYKWAPGEYSNSFLCEPYYELALISVREGRWGQAESYLVQLEQSCTDMKHSKFIYEARICSVRASVAKQQGKHTKSIQHLYDALEIYDRHSDYLEAREVAEALAQELEQQQDDQAALDMYRLAVNYQRKFDEVCTLC